MTPDEIKAGLETYSSHGRDCKAYLYPGYGACGCGFNTWKAAALARLCQEPITAVCADVNAERARQDEQWGGPDHDDIHDDNDWMNFIRHQINKWQAEAEGTSHTRERFVKIAALAIAAVETLDRRKAEPV